jgi:hypothetical protein
MPFLLTFAGAKLIFLSNRAAFGIAYDWFHDGFNDTQKEILREAIVDNGLNCAFTLPRLYPVADDRWVQTVWARWTRQPTTALAGGSLRQE